MAYNENTGLANPQTLINAICTFASAAGWTVERNNLVGSNRTATIRLAGVTDYIHIYNDTEDQVAMRVSVGYDSGEPPELQPNVQEFASRTNRLEGPYPRVYFFADNQTINVVIETSHANVLQHLAIGLLEKFGVYNGGTYAEGSWRGDNWLGDYPTSGVHHVAFGSHASQSGEWQPFPGCVRADDIEGGRTNFFHWFGDGSASAEYGRAHCGITSWAGTSAQYGWLGRLTGGADVNAFSGRSIGHPIVVFIDRTGPTLYRSPIGVVRNMRLVNMAKYNNAQEFSISSDVWKVFPAQKRSLITNGASDSPDYGTHTLGYAIKKVV